MSNKSNVINFSKFKNKLDRTEAHSDETEVAKIRRLKGFADESNHGEKVIQLSDRRQEELDTDRRTLTRTVLSQFIGVFVVTPNKSLQPVSIHDVSEGGLAFDMPSEAGTYNIGESVTMRIYLSHDTYFSFSVKVANHRGSESQGASRHGTVFRKDDDAFKTLFYFTKFLESVSQVAKTDKGERVVGRVD